MTTPDIPTTTDAEIDKHAETLIKAQQLVEGTHANSPEAAAYAAVIKELLAIISMLLAPPEPEVDERLQKAFSEAYDDARGRQR